MGDSESRKRAFTTGYILGLSGMPVATALGRASDPLYLYGSAALPPYPDEWNREEYPYAVIIGYNHQYHFCAYREPNYNTKTQLGRKITYFGSPEDGTAQVFTARQGEAAWSQLADTKKEFAVDKDTITNTYIAIWTHGFDLMYSDGELYVAASAPRRITDWDALKGMYFYNDFIAPYSKLAYQDYNSYYIIKTETKYLFIDCVSAMGGAYLVCNGTKTYIYNGEWDYIIGVASRDIDGSEWQSDSLRNYLGEEVEIDGRTYHYLCPKEDIIWSLHDIGDMKSSSVAFYGSEPVPVPEPAEVNTDNKAIVLGCRLGYIVRKQMQKGKADSVPDGALISSDGYILRDCNGVYLIAKEDA